MGRPVIPNYKSKAELNRVLNEYLVKRENILSGALPRNSSLFNCPKKCKDAHKPFCDRHFRSKSYISNLGRPPRVKSEKPQGLSPVIHYFPASVTSSINYDESQKYIDVPVKFEIDEGSNTFSGVQIKTEIPDEDYNTDISVKVEKPDISYADIPIKVEKPDKSYAEMSIEVETPDKSYTECIQGFFMDYTEPDGTDKDHPLQKVRNWIRSTPKRIYRKKKSKASIAQTARRRREKQARSACQPPLSISTDS